MLATLRRILLLAACVFASGCAELSSIYHNRLIAKDYRAVSLDAKQRNVFVGKVGKDYRLCAEAAPDAFSAISASASLDADVTQQKAKLAGALAEAVGTIERTQTVNLLRESMYRTCERYLSGAIGKSSFVVQAARDQRAMVAVLAIEQLTRTARPAATIISAPATSAAVANASGAKLIEDFAKQKTDAQASVAAADAAFKAALTTGKCETVTVAPANDEAATDPTLSNWAACNTAKTALAARRSDLAAASDRLDKVIDVAASLTSATSAATLAGVNQGGGGAAPDPTAISRIAHTVREIAAAPGIDEPLMFCIAYLSSDDADIKKQRSVTDVCLRIVAFRSRTDEVLRSKQLTGTLEGTGISVGSFMSDLPDSQSGTVLQNYFSATDKTVADRRFALAAQAAVAIGLPTDPKSMIDLAAMGDGLDRERLLGALLQIETDAIGRAILLAQ